MLRPLLCIFTVVALLAAGGTAAAKRSATNEWWRQGDPLPTGDAGPLALPADVVLCGDPVVADLFAGQDLDVGGITIVNDAGRLYVTFQASGSYTFGVLHLWVGTDLLDVPSTATGTPIPGQFPYQVDAAGGQTHTFVLDLGTEEMPAACGTSLQVVAHAEVTTDGGASGEHETAFAGDTPGGGPRWWYSTDYVLQCCDDDPSGGSFETAYAKGGFVWTTNRRSNPEGLPTLALTKNRWGWAINLPAVEQTTVTHYDLWAGCGLNDTDRGVRVGRVTITWDGTDVQVTYDLDVGITMSELHVYASDAAPTTIAPGQYGSLEHFDPYADSADVTVEGVDEGDPDGDGIWVVAHAVVFGAL